MRFASLYDKKHLMSCLGWMVVVCLLMGQTKGAGIAIAIPMIFYGMIARRTVILFFWTLMLICSVVINYNFAPKGMAFTVIQRGSLVALGCYFMVNLISRPKNRLVKLFLFLYVYIFYMCLSSLQGWNPFISYLKLILFTLIYASLVSVANRVGRDRMTSSREIRSVMLAIAVFFVLGSMILVPFPQYSQMRAEDFLDNPMTVSLYMGMANHSQSLGPLVSSIAVIVFADLLFSIKRWDWLYVVILISCPYLVYKTSSRTGMGAYVLGMTYVGWLFMRAHGIGSRWKSRALSVLMSVMAIGGIVAMSTPSIREGVVKFLMKSSEVSSDVTTENVMSSRQGLIDRALYNFKQSPIFGNGFQVGENMIGVRPSTTILSAPIEKGVWVVAVLEEGGIIGETLFVVFLLVGIWGSAHRGAYMASAALFVAMLTNLGEFTFFSMSYTGGIIWSMVFIGLALDIRRVQDESGFSPYIKIGE